MVRITWYGHACFSITLSSGYTIVIDPHDGASIGLPRPDIKADLVLVTHDHFDHNAINVVKKDGTRILKQFYGETVIDNIEVKGFKTYHDKYCGKRRGENTVYIVKAEGIRIAHLGDLGHIPSGELLEELKNIDILLIPVGGVYTIAPDEAWEIVNTVRPAITIPMHYWIKGLTLPIYRVDDFIPYVKKIKVSRLDTNYIDVTRESLPTEPTIVILKY